MQRDREQFWLVVACVIAAHAAALAVGTVGWVYSGGGEWSVRNSLEVAAADPVVVMKEADPPDDNRLGEANGAGKSIATVDLPQPTVSDKPSDFEQAWTRQKPVPLPSQSSSEMAAPSQATLSLGPQSVTAMSPLAVKQPEATTNAPPPPSEAPQAAEKPASDVKSPADAPDPAVAGKSDLDPFAEEEGVSFSPGGTAARKGRDVKLTRPRVDLGFMAEATRIWGRGLVVRMRIETDATGHPSRVVVLDSSGSDLIDDAVRLAMYDSWFGGKMPDAFAFTVRFVER